MFLVDILECLVLVSIKMGVNYIPRTSPLLRSLVLVLDISASSKCESIYFCNSLTLIIEHLVLVLIEYSIVFLS